MNHRPSHFLRAALGIAAFAILGGCALHASAPAEEESGISAETEAPHGPLANPPSPRDRIVTIRFRLATDGLQTLSRQTERWARDAGGYVEAQFINEEELTTTLRVPSDASDRFVERVRERTEVLEEDRQVEDVTGARANLEARLRAAEKQEGRLLEILGDRTAALDDVLAVEQELARIREKIETLESSHKQMKQRIHYTTVHIRAQLRPDSIALHPWSTLSKNAVDGLALVQSCTIGFIAVILRIGPTLVALLLVVWLVRVFLRRLRTAS